MWLFFGLVTVLMEFATTVWNNRLKLPAAQLNFWRCLYTTLILSLGLPFLDYAHDSGFYISALFAGVTSTITSISIFYTARHHSAHTAALFMPVAMVLTFIGWTVVDPLFRAGLMAQPALAGIIMAAMLVANIAIIKMRNINIGGMQYGWLVALNASVIAIAHIFVKKTTGATLNDVFLLSWILFFIQTLSSAFVCKVQGDGLGAPLFKLSFLFLCGCGFIRGFTLWFAVILAPNPSFVAALMLVVPFMTGLYHRLSRDDIHDSFLPGLIVTLCSIIIVALSFGFRAGG